MKMRKLLALSILGAGTMTTAISTTACGCKCSTNDAAFTSFIAQNLGILKIEKGTDGDKEVVTLKPLAKIDQVTVKAETKDSAWNMFLTFKVGNIKSGEALKTAIKDQETEANKSIPTDLKTAEGQALKNTILEARAFITKLGATVKDGVWTLPPEAVYSIEVTNPYSNFTKKIVNNNEVVEQKMMGSFTIKAEWTIKKADAADQKNVKTITHEFELDTAKPDAGKIDKLDTGDLQNKNWAANLKIEENDKVQDFLKKILASFKASNPKVFAEFTYLSQLFEGKPIAFISEQNTDKTITNDTTFTGVKDTFAIMIAGSRVYEITIPGEEDKKDADENPAVETQNSEVDNTNEALTVQPEENNENDSDKNEEELTNPTETA